MALVTPIRPMADGTLIEFFMHEEGQLTGRRLRRVEAAHAALLACIDAQAPILLPDIDRIGLEYARGAVSRILPPPALLDVLPVFLDERRWHGDDLQDRRVRTELAWALAQHLRHRNALVDDESFEAVRTAVWRSRTAVRRARADAERLRVEARGTFIEAPAWLLDPTRDRSRSSVIRTP